MFIHWVWNITIFWSASVENGWHRSATSIYFESFPYKVIQETRFIDYDKLEEKALDFRPKLTICGGSAYPRDWEYARFHAIADKCGAMLLCDVAHISGLVATRVPLVFLLTFFSTVN